MINFYKTKMKKYKLKQDVLGIPAGTVAQELDGVVTFWNPAKDYRLVVGLDSQYIEEVTTNKRWRSTHSTELYHYITDELTINSVSENHDRLVATRRYGVGNYFQTKEQAQKALDKQILIQEIRDLRDEHEEYSRENATYVLVQYLTGHISHITRSGFIDSNDLDFCELDTVSAVIKHFGDRLNLLFED